MARRGLTLLEVMLVLALLAAMAALMFTGGSIKLQQAAIQSSADDVRAALGRTRLAAIEEGRAYEFVCYEDGSYEARPQVEIEPGAFEDEDDKPAPWRHESQLPRDVVFVRVQQYPYQDLPLTDDELDEDVEDETDPDVPEEGFPPIVFHPDGTSHNAVIELVGPEGRTVEIALRGLTGQARVVTPEAPPEEY